MGSHRSDVRKLGSLALVFVFFFEATVFAQVRAVSAMRPRAPSPAPKPVKSPYVFRSEQELIASIVERAEALATLSTTTSALAPAPAPAARPTPLPRDVFIPLGNWSQEGDPAHGAWELSPSGYEVTQKLAEGPTFFVSHDEHIDTTLTGKLRVSPQASEDGVFGFVLGYRAPLAAEGHDDERTELVLFDWSGRDSILDEGFTLARVHGQVTYPHPVYRLRADAPQRLVDVLASDYGDGKGWQKSRWYPFEISYRRGRLRVRIDGRDVFDVADAFVPGRIGFYTYGQAEVTFANVDAERVNRRPTAVIDGERFFDVGLGCRAHVTLDGSASADPDGDPLDYLWSGPFGAVTGVRPQVSLTPGTHTIGLEVADGAGLSSTTSIELTVSETGNLPSCPSSADSAPRSTLLGSEGPSVAVTADLQELWPPNHELVDVGLTVIATDPSRLDPAVSVSVWSDEAELARGSGNHAPDAVVHDGALFLRSERSGPGDGRVFLIIATATGPGPGGLEDYACTAVVVPHSMSPAQRAAVKEQARLAVEACEATGAPPEDYLLLEESAFPVTAPLQSLVPTLLCVVPNERAFFGYDNESPVPVYVDVSSDNRLVPPPDDQGQPTAFLPGVVDAAFGVRFDGSDIAWHLTGPDGVERLATASVGAPECDVVPSLPDARDDEATTDAETPVTLDVLANDVDPEGDPLTLARTTAPANGTLTLELDGGVTYTPAAGFTGSDAFTYTVTDGLGWDQARVVVTVEGGDVNQPPFVDAGSDVTIQLPETTAALDGTVTDDGLPNGTLDVLWSQLDGPGPVVFDDPASPSTTATFPTDGVYTLRLTADDSELTASDELTLTVLPLPVIAISIGDVSVDENAGEALVPVTLSAPALAPISVDFLTFDGTALAGCDYVTRYGTLELAAGASGGTIAVPIVDDLAIESDESFFVRLGNPLGAVLGDDEATVAIRNDDTTNLAPASPHDRTPTDGAIGLSPNPTLAWQSSEPDSDPLTFDVYFGTSFSTDGQSWTQSCPAGVAPEPRAFGASVLDETNDRLILFGGATASGESSDVWVLDNATGTRGAPTWTALLPAPGPTPRQRAAHAYDAANNRLLVSGGCTSDCTVALADAWVLTNANGLGGTPQWIALPDAPSTHAGAAFVFDATHERIFVVAENDVLVLDIRSPAWSVLPTTGDVPAPRTLALAAHDATTDTLLLVGGRLDGDVATNDVYALSLESGEWSKLTPMGLLPARYAHAGFYEPASGRLIVFGGSSSGLDSDTNLVAGDVWMLENAFKANPGWRMLSPANAPVPARLGAQAAYSSYENRFVVVSGGNNRTETVHDDVLVLRDAVGSLPLVSVDQTAASFSSATPDVSETHFWRVVAKDDRGARAGAPVFRFRPNAEPTVDAGADLEIRLPDVAILDATATDDGLESPLTFLWEAVFGPAPVSFADATAEDTTASFATAGVYTLRLTVNDGAFEASDTLVVTVLDANQAPSVDTGDDLSVTFPDDTVLLTASVTDGFVPGDLGFSWTVVSGPAPVVFGSPDAISTTATFTTRGTYVLRLSVSDGELTGFDEVVVTVIQPNAAPNVDAGADQTAAAVTDTVTLFGTVTDDGLPTGTLTTSWSLVAGPGVVTFGDPTSPTTTATFDTAGAYVLHLTASDSELSAFDEMTVTVGDPGLLADLTVSSVDTSALFVDPQTLEMSGTVAAVVSNGGGGPAIGPFEIAFFEDTNQNRTFEPLDDNVLGTAELLALDASASSSAFATLVAGRTMLFSGNLIFAFVDSGGAVPETDETNNLGSSAAQCDFTPLPSTWSPTLEWSWTASSVRPANVQVIMTPVVIDLDGDGIADVVFTSYALNNTVANGVLRAISGRDGTELFTVSDPAFELSPLAQLAAGDIDSDGRPEIVAVHENDRLIAFEHDGTVKWVGPDLDQTAQWGAPALAQLDGAGEPEIVFGREVFNATDGTLRWRGTGGRGSIKGPLALVADVDLDTSPEIVAGNTVYEADGTILWQNTSLPDGVNAIGNFDADDFLEIVLVAQAKIWLLEHDGTVKWGPTSFPFNPITGGPPVVADFDGDGEPEIGVPDFDRYYVFETDGTVKWQVPIEENSAGNGSSAFDFEGDGASELVYADTQTLRIHRGADGAILFQTDIGNNTAYEAALVADVDSDGDAEIVAVANTGAGGDRAGVFVFGDANDHWALARPIWNQFSYHITNVNDDGTIPNVEANGWQSFNSYRENAFIGVNENETSVGCQFAKPDLTASFLRKTVGASDVTLTARIGNGGAAVVGPGVPVSLYDGDPLLNRKLATVRTTTYLEPGQFEDVSFVVPSSLVTQSSLWVVADDFGGLKGTVTESDETNNAVDSGIALVGNTGPGGGDDPDLVATRVDVSGVTVDGQTLIASGTVTAEVRNQGTSDVTSPFELTFFEDRDGDGALSGADNVVGTANLPSLAAGATAQASATVMGTLLFVGSRLHVFVDSANVVPESNESNNVTATGEACTVAPTPTGSFTPEVEWSWTSSSVQPQFVHLAATPVVADITKDGVPDVVFTTFSATFQGTGVAYLRAVDGRTGAELFTVDGTNERLDGLAGIAVGDLDGNDLPDIVGLDDSNRNLIAFEYDPTPGTVNVKWVSVLLDQVGTGAPAIADLDGDGLAEVVIGRQVVNGLDGTLVFTGSGTARGRAFEELSIALDLDLDGTLELVAGNTAYEHDGSVHWTTALPDGTVAAGNLDADDFPELVHVENNRVRVLEHTGELKWGPLALDGIGFAAPAVVADFDGDGRFEIALARRDEIFLIETGGFVRWMAPVSHTTTTRNEGAAASAFDFDGDGASELVYSDDSGLRIFSGRDGSLVGSLPLTNCNHSTGYPSIADVDNDGEAEILYPTSAQCSVSDTFGLHAIGEASGSWVRARSVWNQNAYFVANVEDDGSIPASVAPGFDSGFRSQEHGEEALFNAADLTASFVRQAEDGTDLLFTVRIGNAGAALVGPGISVGMYNGNPALGFPKVDTVLTTGAIEAGGFEDVTFRVASSVTAESSLFFIADDADNVPECDEENNGYDSGLFLNQPPMVDAGEDAFTALPSAESTISLEGSVTDDGYPLPSSLVSTWGRIAGPAGSDINPPQFDDRFALATNVRFFIPGTYVLRLQVNDGSLFGSDTLTVVVDPANQAPVVDAGPDAVVELPDGIRALNGSVTDDGLPSNGTLTTAWTQISGPTPATFDDASSPTTTVTFTQLGDYVLRLTADDGKENVSDDVATTVTPPNQAPVVDAGPDETVFSPSTFLKGTATDDGLPPGSVLDVTWSIVSAPGTVVFADSSSPSTLVEFGANGVYVLRLTADDGALIASDDVTITADVTNVAPVVNAGSDVFLLLPTDTTTLNGTVTDDGLPVGSTLLHVWNQLSGPGPVVFGDQFSLTTTATFAAAGTYVLSLQASDTELVSTDELTVVVNDGNVAPVVDAGADQAINLPTNQLVLTGTANDDGLPAGSTLTYTWSQVSGPGLAVFSTPNALSTTVTFEAAGDYVLRFTASDGLLSTSDPVSVSVLTSPAGPVPVVAITSPTERQGITDFTDVIGSVTSDDLLSWKLETRHRGTTDFIRIASGTTPVANGVLGVFDPTLLMNGLHEIRLTATDNAGQSASVSVFVVVKENLKIGHFTVSFVDLEVPVSGLPIRITRTYDSRDKRLGDFGFGWRMDISSIDVAENSFLGLSWLGQRTFGGLGSYCVTPAKPGVVTITMPDGEVFEFEPVFSPQCQLVPPTDGTMSFRGLPGTHATLEPVDGNFVYVVGSFAPPTEPPSPLSLYDASFNLYDPDVYRLTLPDGRTFVIDQDEGLKSITDLNGNTLTVTPTGIAHSSGKAVSFERDFEGRIQKIVDPNGNPMFYGYDAQGDLTSYTDRENNETSFGYLDAIPHHLDDIEDPRGISPIRNDYDPVSGRLIRHTDAFGNTIEYDHNLGARQEVITDRELAVHVLAYDTRGNVVHETDPKGKVILRSFDANNNRTCESEPHDAAQSGVDCESSPNPTLFSYDPRDNLLTQTDAEGNTTTFTYNARDQVETTKDPRQNVTTNIYDPKGNLEKTIDAAGTETTFTYDSRGNVKSQTVIVGGIPHATSFDYDGAGNLTKETDAEGHETVFTYDTNGNRLTESRTRTLADGSLQTLTTTFVYDKQGRLVRTTDPDGTFTRTVYDAIGKQKETFDKLGRKTSFTYDEMGQLDTTTYPDLTTESFTYDKEGRRRSSTDRGGRTTGFEYDGLGRLVKTIYPDLTFTQNVYGDAGRLDQAIDARGKITRFEYDNAGRRKKVIDPLLNETEFFYDANGNQSAIKDPKGNTTAFEYDALNRRTKTIFPDTTFTETGYDELGRRTSETDQAGIVTGFEYDKLGRLVKVIQDVNGLALETTYGYDEVGNRISQTDANLHTTSFRYDELGRETRRTLPDGAFETKSYDAVGNLETWTKFDGNIIRYGYDVNNRLVLKDFPSGTDVTFTYTPTGKRDTVTDARGVTDYDYDVRDRLTTLTYPDGRKLDYGYDKNGNRTGLTATIGTTVLTTTYTYDDASRLDVVTDPNGLDYDHDYDPNGNRELLTQPNGTSTSYVYDELNRLKNLTTTGPTGVIQSYDYALGPAGNRTQVDEADGTTWAYGYDHLYRLTVENVTDTLGALVYRKTFDYDDIGNRQVQTTTGVGAASIAYTFDARDRLLTENGTTYGYDDNGNLTSKSGEATYTWDFEGRLIRATKNDGVVATHVYDADGNRIKTAITQSTGPQQTTEFLVDPSGVLSYVIAESNSAGTFLTYYTRGDDLLSLIRPGESRYYHTDGLGSIRFLTDLNGDVTDSYTHTAFGEEFSHIGGDAQPYKFAGEQYEPRINLYYNRARWFDIATGRFTRPDSFRGVPAIPGTLHQYLYVENNPVNELDPSGLSPLGQLSAASLIRVALVTTSRVGLQTARIVTLRQLAQSILLSAALLAQLHSFDAEDESNDESIVVYRRIRRKKKISNSTFLFNPLLSVSEFKNEEFECHFPFTVVYRPPKVEGVQGRVVEPREPAAGIAIFTPTPEDPGHWDLDWPDPLKNVTLKEAAKAFCKSQ